MFNIKAITMFLTEIPSVSNAANVRKHPIQCLIAFYGTDFHSMWKTFTVLTDAAPVMENISNTSISTRHRHWDLTWMRYHVHVLQNCIKLSFWRYFDKRILRTISADLSLLIDLWRIRNNIDEMRNYPIVSTSFKMFDHELNDISCGLEIFIVREQCAEFD